jgi:DNA-binding NarL/FixJ family response regulator
MKILLVDDHPLFMDGLKNLLSGRGLQVVGTGQNGLEALELARQLRPDLILMDIEMPELDGLAATRLIKAELPDIQIVMLTMSAAEENLFEAIKSGANGYLLKTQDTEEFFQLLLGMANGEAPLSPGLAAKILKEFERGPEVGEDAAPEREVEAGLSPRQVEVLTLVASGLTYKEVGARLHLTERTIKYHMGEIIRTLHMENRAQVIAYARRMGYGG